MRSIKPIFIVLFLLIAGNGFAQVGIGTLTPAPSAQLEVASTNQGFLPPRLTTFRKNNIVAPAEGLLIYQTDSVQGIYVYTGGKWLNMIMGPAAAHYIGEQFGGGIVFYVYDNGRHGLIAATVDQGPEFGIVWDYSFNFAYMNTVRNGIGAGMFNTQTILTKLEPGNYAAWVAMQYEGGGFGDWYLPSKYELNLLWLQHAAVGGFNAGTYWSSTEFDLWSAWYQNMGSGGTDFHNKGITFKVRAIRAF